MKKRIIPILLMMVVLLAGLGTGTSGAQGRVSEGDPGAMTWEEPLTSMEFVRVSAGCFMMGSPKGEQGRGEDEGAVREVCVDGFWMGVKEVSRGEFAQFVAATGYKTDAERQGFSWVYTGEWSSRAGFHWADTGFEQSDTHPVVHVSWNDARAMARWLSEKSDGNYRLPTEAEWEYACRAGSAASRFWGDDPDMGCDYANAADLTAQERFPAWVVAQCDDGFVFTAPTGHFKANAFRMHDMLGNVWEWVHDHYQQDAYKTLSSTNPINQSHRAERTARGGSWNNRPDAVRCARRDALQAPDRRSEDLGFRLIRKTPSPVGEEQPLSLQ